MKISNKFGFPSSIVRAVEKEYEYKPKRYSVTSLLQTDRELMLKRRYNDEIEQDVSEMIWLLFGTSVHYILENIDLEDYEKVEYKMEHTLDNGYTLSGILDYLSDKDKLILDYKVVKTYSYIFDKNNEKYRKQLQMCAWLYYKETGKWYSKGQIIMIFKDWNKTNLLTNKDYPKFPVATVDFDLGTPEEIENWIVNKFKHIQYLEGLSDLDLPLCSKEERFNTGDKYAVKKKVWKKAFRVFDNLNDARELLITLEQKYPGEYEIEERIGEDKKCKNYCSCCNFCPYYIEHYDEEHKMIMEEMQNV
jgi:hypothetical protein